MKLTADLPFGWDLHFVRSSTQPQKLFHTGAFAIRVARTVLRSLNALASYTPIWCSSACVSKRMEAYASLGSFNQWMNVGGFERALSKATNLKVGKMLATKNLFVVFDRWNDTNCCTAQIMRDDSIRHEDYLRLCGRRRPIVTGRYFER